MSPEAGVKRAAARRRIEILNSGYGNYGASHTKKSTLGWAFGGGSSKEDIEDNLSILRERSRDLYMGVPLATGAIKTMRTNVVGSGLVLKSQVDYEYLRLSEERAQQLESDIEREFNLWAESESCDVERIDNFYELQQLAFLNWLLSGDVLTLLPTTKRVNSPYDLRIRLIESDRLCTPRGKEYDPNIISGVETNTAGEVVAYHVLNKHPLSREFGTAAEEWQRVKAFGEKTGRRNVLHIMNRERIGQRRGVPFLAPVIEALKQLGRYTDAELVAAVVNGMFAVFIEKEGDDGGADGEVLSNTGQDGLDPNDIKLENGSIIDLAVGEKANGVSPGRPNANFDPFVIAICRQIGAALGIPYELLVLNFTSSYSASRGALLEAWKNFRMYRTWLARDFCQPIFEEWLSEAVAKGRIAAPGFFADAAIKKAYSGAEWNGPAQGLLNPVQEVNAAEKRVQNGFSTRDREAQELTGSDFYKNAQQRKREEKLMKEVRDIEQGTEQQTAGQQPEKPEEQPAEPPEKSTGNK